MEPTIKAPISSAPTLIAPSSSNGHRLMKVAFYNTKLINVVQPAKFVVSLIKEASVMAIFFFTFTQSSGDDLKKLSTCTVGRKTYYEGQKMYARGRCISCICGKDYENKPFEENKHCHRVSCDLDLHYGKRIKNGCIPIYFKNDGCCPIGWRCPDEETAVVQDSSRKVLNDDPLLKCTFGKLILNVGDKLTPQDDADSCTVCSCKTPPFAHCVKKC